MVYVWGARDITIQLIVTDFKSEVWSAEESSSKIYVEHVQHEAPPFSTPAIPKLESEHALTQLWAVTAPKGVSGLLRTLEVSESLFCKTHTSSSVTGPLPDKEVRYITVYAYWRHLCEV